MLIEFGRKLTRLQSYTSGTAEHVLEWGGLSRPALSILKLGGKILKFDFLNGWKFSAVPVRVRMSLLREWKDYRRERFFARRVSFVVETGGNTEFALGSSLISFTVGNSQQRVVTCRHFVALVSLFQGRVACWNLPLTGPFQMAQFYSQHCWVPSPSSPFLWATAGTTPGQWPPPLPHLLPPSL